jgi:putative nucleotidyltransferase with HDIG domain
MVGHHGDYFVFCPSKNIRNVNTPLSNIKKYSQLLFKIAMFAAAAVAVLYMLPREGKFKYEFAKGRFWKHGVLISDFDFPILKTEEQLRNDKDSALKAFKPYFEMDTSFAETEIAQFEADFLRNYPDIRKDYPFLKTLTGNRSLSLQTVLSNCISSKLNDAYKQGIIELPDEYSNPPIDFEFKVIKGNFAEPFGLSEVQTPISAYRKLQKDLLIWIVDTLHPSSNIQYEEISAFISQLQLNKFLQSNITYDKSRTEVEKQNLLKNVMLTSGAISAGQRIIATGEMVDEHTYQILASYKNAFESKLGTATGYVHILIGQFLIVFAFFSGVYLFLFFFRRDVFNNNKGVASILILMVSMILMAKVSLVYVSIFMIPFAILPITVRTFFDSRLALFIHIMTILLASFFAQNSFQFVFLQIPAGITAIFGLVRIERRSQLVKASFFIALVYALLYTALYLWQEGDIRKIDPLIYAKFGLNGGLLLLTYLAIYIFEKLFGFVSDVTLAELSNTNHPLLLQLAEQTPGTFHHSIQVGTLAVAAVKRIGGNPVLTYAGAMYHDIGKMDAPSFYTENQISGINPLDKVDFEEGARLVISHIENGIRLATKHKLPTQVIDFIATHQGTTKTKYFYNSYINKYPNKNPDISHFSYPGPTPFTKETAVLMMADAIEASSRSLSNYSDDEIDKLVERIVNDQMEQGQFFNAPITLKEISEVKEVFKRRLKIIYHSRVSYPEIVARK